MIDVMSKSTIVIAFNELSDPRKDRNRLYSLQDIVCTAIMATICSCNDYDEISDWTESHLDWLQSIGLCKEGAPSHDTYERFFRHLDSKQFQACFIKWTQILKGLMGKRIAIDGKTLCGSKDGGESALHLVSAFATESSLVLGQIKTNGKGGELAGIQQLLEILDLKDAVITIDAGGCHKVVTQKIIEKKGDYTLCVKGNQQKLHDELENFFTQAIMLEPVESGCGYWSIEENAKGRKEKREVWTSGDLDWLPKVNDWAGLQSIIAVRRTTLKGDKETIETRFFISSLPPEAEHQGNIIRGHWGIENELHWQLDVTFREDLSRVRKDNGAENLSVLRRSTLNILKGDKSSKKSLKRRRLQASWDLNYLSKLMIDVN